MICNSASFLSIATLLLATETLAYGSGAKPPHYVRKQFSQESVESYSALRYVAGSGPWHQGSGVGINRDPPESCTVDQVVMVARHGERYPDPGTGKKQQDALKKLSNYNRTLQGSLYFYNDWENVLAEDVTFWAQETFSGPYSGLSNAYTAGAEYRARYGSLWDGTPLPIWASGYERVINTARMFGQGFLPYNYTDSVYINIIPEDETQGANSLTPSCNLNTSATNKCDKVGNLDYFPIFQNAADRLNKENPGLNLTASEAKNLMGIVGPELNVKGYSPWYDVFTPEEWVTYQYITGDTTYYYCAGPGTADSVATGSPFINATKTLFNQGPDEAGSLFFTFAHDGDITRLLTTLGVAIPKKDLPLDHVTFDSDYYYPSTDLVPMGARLVLERLSCNKTSAYDAGNYVRIVLNEAVMPLDNCTDGPGFSCSLSNYTSYIDSRIVDYPSICKIPSNYSQTLDFFWNYNHTTQYNAFTPISYQLALANE